FQPPDATPQKAKRKNLNSYSPTTGTRRMSPFSSPTSHSAQNPRNPPSQNGNEQRDSNGRFSRRGQPQTEQDAFLELQSRVRSSLPRILKIRANLTSLKALEGSRELENVIGASHSSCVLSAELQKTQALSKEGGSIHSSLHNH
ncbi:CENPR protein, partial [Menura novaehollandiae]|nr:CENPR protein [Menura novaehollandiae]